MLRHSVRHAPPDFLDIACWMAEATAALCLPEREDQYYLNTIIPSKVYRSRNHRCSCSCVVWYCSTVPRWPQYFELVYNCTKINPKLFLVIDLFIYGRTDRLSCNYTSIYTTVKIFCLYNLYFHYTALKILPLHYMPINISSFR